MASSNVYGDLSWKIRPEGSLLSFPCSGEAGNEFGLRGAGCPLRRRSLRNEPNRRWGSPASQWRRSAYPHRQTTKDVEKPGVPNKLPVPLFDPIGGEAATWPGWQGQAVWGPRRSETRALIIEPLPPVRRKRGALRGRAGECGVEFLLRGRGAPLGKFLLVRSMACPGVAFSSIAMHACLEGSKTLAKRKDRPPFRPIFQYLPACIQGGKSFLFAFATSAGDELRLWRTGRTSLLQAAQQARRLENGIVNGSSPPCLVGAICSCNSSVIKHRPSSHS